MKNESDLLNLLDKEINIKIPDELDRKNLLTIHKIAAESKKLKKPMFIFKPAFGIAAVIVAVISFLIISSNIKSEDISVTENISDNNVIVQDTKENILLSEDETDFTEKITGIYLVEVSNAAVKITSGGRIVNWENPDDSQFSEVKIEKYLNNIDYINVYSGTLNMYVDKEALEPAFYLIKVVDVEGNVSEGVRVELP